MKNRLRTLTAAAAAFVLTVTSAVNSGVMKTADAAYGTGGNGTAIMEYLDRGIYAVKNGNGMFVSWRWNADDADDAEFRLYRDDKLIYTSKSGDATSYQDNGGSANSKYRVDTIENGKVVTSQNCKFNSGTNYFDIPLKKPGSQYSPNDCCVGDVDGDGQYEIFLKWDPSNSQDNSKGGKTDKVYIDCYTLEGKQLWRIDMGVNVRAGQHYTQMCVADFDCDGKAELITKTADGTKDGAGKVIGNGNKSYVNGDGRVLDGPEFLTLFEGATGKALDTIDFPVPRGKVSDWGDNYGNRVDRFNSAIAYLDGVHPSAVYGRGYYTRLTLSAVDVKGGKLVKRWVYDTGNNKNTPGWGCGNHNVMVADSDNDGKQEIFMGASAIDDNGKLMWTTGQKHGDAMHLGDFLPDREGLELWLCHEDKPYGESCLDAKTGKTIFHINGTKDTGRCAADNVYAGSKGAEFWGAADGNVYNTSGKKIGGTKPAQNFFIYWDGDLEREILDGNKISKMKGADKIDRIFTANGCGSNNSSKSVPCMTADLFGDWREELILRTDDNSKLRIWCTTSNTKVRLTTLMHDMQYRMQNGCQQSAYNQPPHVSYYLGSEAPLPARPSVVVNGKGTGNTQPQQPTQPSQPQQPTQPVEPPVSPLNMKFDLGANAQNGYTSVKSSDVYSSSKGYGFSSASGVSNVSAAGKGALSDAVQFTGKSTFNVDLPKGLYKIKVTLGNTTRTSVYMEDMLQIVNMTGNNAVDEILLPVTDGQLNIRAAAGKAGYAYTISLVEIEKVSDNAVLPNTVWLCGDSTVCNYYPKDTSAQAGWGQVLDKYLDKGWNVRNMAASGQYAKGFVDAGQFDAIEHYGKAGDVYIISIGINDTNYSDKTEYYNTVTDMVKRAKAKGMDVILVKQQGRKGDYTKNPLLKSRWFAAELDRIGSEQKVKVVDLFNLFQDYCVSIGASKADGLYIDNIHPNRQGAMILAELFAKQNDWTIGSGTQPGTPVTPPQSGSELQDGAVYMIKNANSGLYLAVDGGAAENSSNVVQNSGSGDAFGWKAVSAGNGYYSLISRTGDGETYALDVSAKSTEDGANVEIYTYKSGDNQQFKFIKNSDGTYTILTKHSGDSSCIEIASRSTEVGGNVQQWTVNGGANQKWILEPFSGSVKPSEPDVTVKPGDINADGQVNVADAVKLQKHLLAVEALTKSEAAAADLYSDGVIDVFDMVLMRKLLVSGNAEVYYYAVNASYVNGTEETVNEGYKSKAYINLDNSTDSSIEWTFNTSSAGNYLVTFRVANGTDNDRAMKVEVNNASDHWVQSFTGTGAWTQWEERGIVLPFVAGNNVVKLTSMTDNGGPNFDYAKIEKTDEPIAETYIPQTQPDIPQSENPVIYIAGDSTVQSYRASYAPQQGWGYYLGDYFNNNVTVSNQAIAGRSSKSFYDNGRLKTILDSMKTGDYLLIQFGINDSAVNNAERYAPVCGNVNNPTDGSFEYYISKYIEGAKQKGGTPVLVTTVIGLKAYSGGKFVNSYGNYCKAMKDMAAKYSIPCIDLNSIMVDHYNSIGYDEAYSYHLCGAVAGSNDKTHFTEKGAKAVAGLVADALKKANLPLSQYVK